MYTNKIKVKLSNHALKTNKKYKFEICSNSHSLSEHISETILSEIIRPYFGKHIVVRIIPIGQ